MGKGLLDADALKRNAKLRSLIKSFLSDDNKDEPEEVLDHIAGNADELTFLVPTDMDKKKSEEFNNLKEGETIPFDIYLKLIDDDEGRMWLPVFTSEEAANAGDDDEEMSLIPNDLYVIRDQISNNAEVEENEDKKITGIVIDPWTNAFPLEKDDLDSLLDGPSEDEPGISLVKCGIETIDTDAIVNSSNNTLAPGKGGVNGDIHRAAGKGLAEECRTLGGCRTGEAKITDSYDLPCKYVIHTVGPIYSGKAKDADDLADCYDNSLYLAREHGLRSVAFPCISTGDFGYPKEDAMDIAVQTVLNWFMENDDYAMAVTFVTNDEDNFKMYQEYLNSELGEPDPESED